MIGHLDALLKTQLLVNAGFEHLELLQGVCLIREQVQARLLILLDLDLALADAVIEPIEGEVQDFGQLGNGEIARNQACFGFFRPSEEALL